MNNSAPHFLQYVLISSFVFSPQTMHLTNLGLFGLINSTRNAMIGDKKIEMMNVRKKPIFFRVPMQPRMTAMNR